MYKLWSTYMRFTVWLTEVKLLGWRPALGFLCGVCLFSSRLCGVSPGTLVSFHSRKTGARLIDDAKITMAVNVSRAVCLFDDLFSREEAEWLQWRGKNEKWLDMGETKKRKAESGSNKLELQFPVMLSSGPVWTRLLFIVFKVCMGWCDRTP